MNFFEFIKNLINRNSNNRLNEPSVNVNNQEPLEIKTDNEKSNNNPHKKFAKRVALAVTTAGVTMGIAGCGNTQSQDLTFEQASQAMIDGIKDYDILIDQYIDEHLNGQAQNTSTSSSVIPTSSSVTSNPVTQEQLNEKAQEIKEAYVAIDQAIKKEDGTETKKKIDKESTDNLYQAWLYDQDITECINNVEEYLYNIDLTGRTDDFKNTENELLKDSVITFNSVQNCKSMYDGTEVLNYIESVMPGYQSVLEDIHSNASDNRVTTFKIVRGNSGRDVRVKFGTDKYKDKDKDGPITEIVEFNKNVDNQAENENIAPEIDVLYVSTDLNAEPSKPSETFGEKLERWADASEKW